MVKSWDTSKSEGCLGSNSGSVPTIFVVLTKQRARYLSEFLSSSVNKDDDGDDDGDNGDDETSLNTTGYFKDEVLSTLHLTE